MGNNINDEIERLIDESDSEYEKDNFTKSILLLKRAWKLLPEPKINDDNSFFIMKDMIEINLLLDKPQEADKLIEVFYECDKDRDDLGDRKYIEGKVAFALGDLERAKSLFIDANKLTKGRCFEPNDTEYKKLIK